MTNDARQAWQMASAYREQDRSLRQRAPMLNALFDDHREHEAPRFSRGSRHVMNAAGKRADVGVVRTTEQAPYGEVWRNGKYCTISLFPFRYARFAPVWL